MMNVDWYALAQQKALLVRLAVERSEDAFLLDGLIHLLDNIQDSAVRNGEATEAEVFNQGESK
jgi:hypothetical protein